MVVQEPSSTQSKRLTIDSWLASSGSLAAADIYPAATDCVRIVLRRTCYNTPAQTHICYTSLKVLGLFIARSVASARRVAVAWRLNGMHRVLDCSWNEKEGGWQSLIQNPADVREKMLDGEAIVFESLED